MSIEVQPVVSSQDVEAWRQVHNAVIPSHVLSVDDVRERLGRTRLILALADGDVVGDATVRPATAEGPATGIVRILPTHRRQGHGTECWRRILADDASLRGTPLATVVLTANDDGLRFAAALGVVEVQRHEVGCAEYADMLRGTSPA